MFVKITLTFATPLDVLAHRFSIAFIFINLFVLIKKPPLQLAKKDILRIVFLSLLYPILFFGFQVFGLVYTSSSVAGIIQATVPIFTLIFSTLILKEGSSIGQKIAMGLSLIGIIIMMSMQGTDGKGVALWGMGLILFSTLSQSLFNKTVFVVSDHIFSNRHRVLSIQSIIFISSCVA